MKRANDFSVAPVIRSWGGWLWLACIAAGPASAADPGAATVPGAATQAAAQAVFMRAEVRSVFEEEGGAKRFIRLKLRPRSKIPFTVLTYRVLDRRLIEAFPVGSAVEFVAERRDGENVLTQLRAAPRCERFQPC